MQISKDKKKHLSYKQHRILTKNPTKNWGPPDTLTISEHHSSSGALRIRWFWARGFHLSAHIFFSGWLWLLYVCTRYEMYILYIYILNQIKKPKHLTSTVSWEVSSTQTFFWVTSKIVSTFNQPQSQRKKRVRMWWWRMGVAQLPGGTVGHEGHLTAKEIWAWPEMRNESWWTTCHSCGYAIYSRCLHLVNILGSNFLRCFPWHLQCETSQLMIPTHLLANKGKHCKKPSWALPAAGPASCNGERVLASRVLNNILS